MTGKLSSSVGIGVIQNPFSTLNRKRYGVVQAAGSDPTIHVEQAGQTDDIKDILIRYRDAGLGLIVVDGGDGTVREVLTRLPLVYGSELPALCVLPSGKTNVCAHDTGTAKYKRQAFSRLLAMRASGTLAGHVRRRSVLGIEWEDGFHEPVKGMLLGFGGFREATNLAQSHVHSKGLNHNAAVAMTLFSFFYGAIFGRDDRGLRLGEEMSVSFNGQEAVTHARFGLILTTLHSFVLGVWPFWDDDEQAISWLDIKAPPPRLLRAVLAVFLKRIKPWMAEAGYRSGSASHLTIETHKPFIIDGETFEPGPKGRLRITSDMQIDFIAP